MTDHRPNQPSADIFAWRPEFALGVEDMDAQHREMVARAAELNAAVAAGRSRDELMKCAAALIDVTRRHFAWEEQLMLASGYEGYESHKAQHYKLIKQLLQVEDDLWATRVKSCQALGLFLESWTTHHVSGADLPLAEFLKQRG